MTATAIEFGPFRRLAYVLDDEINIGHLVCQYLTACSYQARQFSETQSFLTQVKTDPPRLVVIDLALGETDAVDVIGKLEILKYQGEVLLISGRDLTVLREIEQVGVAHGLAMLPPLQKPFRIGDLKKSLATSPDVAVRDAPRSAPAVAASPSLDLEKALNSDRLDVWYQPKIDLAKKVMCGAEAMLQLRDPATGEIMPVEVMPSSTDPLYRPLTSFVLRRVMGDWIKLAAEGLVLKFAINIPVSVLCAAEFVPLIRQITPQDRAFPGVIAEIAEDEIVRDAGSVQELAAQLKIYGVTLSIDDFGAANSSLAHLLDIPCSEIKIDRLFVADCPNDAKKHVLCQSVVDLAHRLGKTVCAKGIQTAGDLQTLIEVGCDTAQGSLFAPAMPASMLTETLLRKRTTQGAPAAMTSAA
jgi:EAL domain-containing protein (putative c-di-GMP-specific phosphodiesterase class I)/ActR/RegA family two-component response regulator